MLEVFLGGWNNTKSVIRRNRTKSNLISKRTPQILNGNEFKRFWIRWTDNVLNVGSDGETAAFMSYDIDEPFRINFVGVCTTL